MTLKSKIIYSQSIQTSLNEWIELYEKNKIFLATEVNVDKLWVSQFSDYFDSHRIKKVVIPAGEPNKKLDSVVRIWEFLSDNGAGRKSLLINIGGGMLTDLAGFAASTFKRGINFINIPTTLLSQVDASIGGKTGINFNGLKNEIGTFKEPVAVIINTNFLKTIDHNNFISGFAEMIKHGFINSREHLGELQKFNFDIIDYVALQKIISNSVEIKKYFVLNDPTENNIRKALNFGHTTGHAIESLAMKQNKPVLHGCAVAWGMIVELFLSMKKCGLAENSVQELTNWLIKIYGTFKIETSDFEELFGLMAHDKKNEGDQINFTLISGIGCFEINKNCDKKLIFEGLDFFRMIQEKI
ncbi:MAG: 3-dehydroquinate synthase [Bacteroidales bacterium]|jgi:3-dehydroquinate synthase|nr:3-dehydroquinate synthase [Bacteroidales bacterium]